MLTLKLLFPFRRLPAEPRHTPQSFPQHIHPPTHPATHPSPAIYLSPCFHSLSVTHPPRSPTPVSTLSSTFLLTQSQIIHGSVCASVSSPIDFTTSGSSIHPLILSTSTYSTIHHLASLPSVHLIIHIQTSSASYLPLSSTHPLNYPPIPHLNHLYISQPPVIPSTPQFHSTIHLHTLLLTKSSIQLLFHPLRQSAICTSTLLNHPSSKQLSTNSYNFTFIHSTS